MSPAWKGSRQLAAAQALAELAKRGLVTKTVGRHGGTFVAAPELEQDLTTLAGFSEQLRRNGIVAGVSAGTGHGSCCGPPGRLRKFSPRGQLRNRRARRTMGSMEIGASAGWSAGGPLIDQDSPLDFEFEGSSASWTWSTSHFDFGLDGPVIPPPPSTARSGSLIPPPPSTALSGSLIPLPPTTALSGSVIPPPPRTALSSCSSIPPPPSTALSGSVIPPPPSTVIPGSAIPPPPRTGR